MRVEKPQIRFSWCACRACGALHSPLAFQKYEGKCARCGKELPAVFNAVYDVYIGEYQGD